MDATRRRTDKKLSLNYLAGFMDGEGSISVITRQHEKRTSQLIFRIVVVNADVTPLRAFRDRFGGFISLRRGNRARRMKPIWRWVNPTGRAGLRVFVNAMRGRLVVKARQLAVVERYLTTTTKLTGGHHHKLPSSELRARTTLAKELRRINAGHTFRATLMANFKRHRSKNQRAGCRLCKPHKANGAKLKDPPRERRKLQQDHE